VLNCLFTQSEWRLCIQYGPELVFKGELIMAPLYKNSIGDWLNFLCVVLPVRAVYFNC